MNNIGISIKHGKNSGGTFQWTCNILKSLNEYCKNPGINIYVFVFDCNDFDLVLNKYPNISVVKFGKIVTFLSTIIENTFAKIPQLRILFSIFLPLNLISILYKIKFMIIPCSLSACLYSKNFIFMFCDLSHKYYPNFSEIGGVSGIKTRELIFSIGCSNAISIIVESEELKKDVSKFYNVKSSKIEVLFQTFTTSLVTRETSINKDLILPSKYIFYPAQLWQHKNHKNLLKAFKIIKKKDDKIKLVLTGFIKKGSNEIFDLIKNLELENDVLYFGYVSNSEIIKLYKNALALVMPTYFGPTNIPTLEAFYYGCPAIISDLPGVREQAKDAALYFDPNNPKSISDVIESIEDKSLRDKLINSGKKRINELSFKNYYNNALHAILNKTIKM